jgi:chromosome segregation ATPase
VFQEMIQHTEESQRGHETLSDLDKEEDNDMDFEKLPCDRERITPTSIEIELLHGLLTSKQDMVWDLTNHVEKLTSKNEKLCTKMLQKPERIKELKGLVNDTKQCIKSQKQKVDDLYNELSFAKDKLSQKGKLCIDLELENSQVNTTLKKAQTDLPVYQIEMSCSYM